MTADTLTPNVSTAEARPGRGPILAWVLRQQGRSLLLWTLAVAAVSAIYASFWEVMGPDGELEALVEGMPEGLATALGYDRIGSPAGYLESTVFGLLAPVLLLVFGLGFAAKVLAGGEEEGTLELELTLPVARGHVLLERYLALVLQVAVLAAASTTVVVLIARSLAMEVATGAIVATGVGLFLLVVSLSSVAFAVGAATGRRGAGLAAGAGLAVASYIADALAPLMDDGAWLERLTPFGWYLGGAPLEQGLDAVAAGYAGLAALAVVAVSLGWLRFRRRDLGV